MARELSQLTHRTDWHERLPRYAWAAEMVGEGSRVLDLGAGTGEGAVLLARAGAASVSAIDASLQMVEEGERRFGDEANLAFFARSVGQNLELEPPSDADFDARETIVHGSVSLDAVKAAQEALDGEFDLVTVLDAGLVQPDETFFGAVKARLASGGRLVIAVRIDSARNLGDVLATLSGQSEAVGPLALSTTEAVEDRFSAHFEHVQLVASRASLVTRIGDGRAPWIEAPDLHSAGALLVVASDEALPEIAGVEVRHALSALSEKLGREIEQLQMRAINHEHRSLLYEEQLGQKDALIDDLEREVRATDQRRREVEVQLARLREELDGLQGELTRPQLLPNAEMERREVESAVATLRETVDAQRMTIDALKTRLSLLQANPLDGSDAAERAQSATNERLVALENEIIARDADIIALRKEAEAAGVAEAASQADAEDARSELERVQQAFGDLRAQLETERDAARTAQRELTGQRDEATSDLASAKHAIARLESELSDARDALTRTQKRAKALESDVAEQVSTAERLQSERDQLEEQFARFRRGRRAKRAGIPTTTSGVVAGAGVTSAQAAFGVGDEDGEDAVDLEARLEDAIAEIAMRDRRIGELESRSKPSPEIESLGDDVPHAALDAEPNFNFVDTRTDLPVPPKPEGGELVEVADVDARESDGGSAESADPAPEAPGRSDDGAGDDGPDDAGSEAGETTAEPDGASDSDASDDASEPGADESGEGDGSSVADDSDESSDADPADAGGSEDADGSGGPNGGDDSGESEGGNSDGSDDAGASDESEDADASSGSDDAEGSGPDDSDDGDEPDDSDGGADSGDSGDSGDGDGNDSDDGNDPDASDEGADSDDSEGAGSKESVTD